MSDKNKANLVRLKDCPIGLFIAGRELCLKTEYGSNEGRIDAYIVSTGEFFWGRAPQTIASQREQLVTPVPADLVAQFVTTLRHPAGSDAEEGRG